MYESFTVDKYFSNGKIIGSGSFANVCKGYNMKTKEDVAIKIIKPGFENKSKKHKKQLAREIDIILRMNHKNIVTCYGVFRHPESSALCIVMELCDGGNLESYLKAKGGKLSEYSAQNVAKQLADGLGYLRKFNIIHRDLKPDNLLIKYTFINGKKKFVLKISDFGLATMLSSKKQLAQTQCGSRLYMAPEVYLGEKYCYKADLWSVGAILHRMICGKSLFNKQPTYEMLKPEARLFNTDKIGKVSNSCLDLLDKLLQNDPNKRIDWNRFINHEFFRFSLCKHLVEFCSTTVQVNEKEDLIDNLLKSVSDMNLNNFEIEKLKIFSINNSLLLDNSSLFDRIVNPEPVLPKHKEDPIIENPVVQQDKLASVLILKHNNISSILRLGDKRLKKSLESDAYVLFKHGLLSIKKMLINTETILSSKPTLKTDLVKYCLKDIYNAFKLYLQKTNSLHTALYVVDNPQLKSIQHIVISYVQYIDKKADIEIMFNKFAKSKNRLTFCISCLEYLSNFIINNEYIVNVNTKCNMELLEILKSKKLTVALIKHYKTNFRNKIIRLNNVLAL